VRAFAPPLLALLLCCAASCSRPSGTNESRTAEAKVALRNLGEAMQQATAELNEGWVTLLDGTSLFGWKANSDLNWTNNGGELSADTGQPGLLLTTFQLADYELMCEYRLAKGGNSGIFLRTPMEPKDPTKDCYEFNLCDSHPAFPTGSLVGRKKNEAPAAGEDVWKEVHLIVEGNRIRATIDGQPVIDFTDDSPDRLTRGHIGLQMNGGRIEFRNVKLKPLGTAPVFSGSDLSGWRVVPGSKSEFEVADGAIHVTGGPGFLETEQTWDDFVLQAEARTNGDGLNSGIFFRAETGTAEAPSNGYEMQRSRSTPAPGRSFAATRRG